MNNERCTDKKKQVKDKNHYRYIIQEIKNIYISHFCIDSKSFFIFHRQYKMRKNTKIKYFDNKNYVDG